MRRQGEDKMTDQIRQKLEAFRPAYNPNAWEALDKRLDKFSNKGGYSSLKSWTIGFVTGLIIALGASYLLFFNKSPQDNQQNISTEIINLRNEINELKEAQRKKYTYAGSENLILDQQSKNAGIKFSKKHKPLNNFYQDLYVNQSPDNYSYSEKNNLNADHEVFKLLNPYFIFIDYDEKDSYDILSVSEKNIIITKEKVKKKRKFQFEWSSFNIKSDGEMYKHFVGPNKIYLNYSPELEIGNFQDDNGVSHKIGIGLSGEVSENMIVSGGINIGQYSWSKESVFRHNEDVVMDSLITTYWIEDSVIRNTGSVNYLDVPVNVSFKVLDINKSTLHVMAGISARFYLKEKYNTDLTIESITQRTQVNYGLFNNYYIPAKLNIGLSYCYTFSDRWSIQAIPKYSISLQELGGNRIKNSSWGLSLNLVYKFRKDRY